MLTPISFQNWIHFFFFCRMHTHTKIFWKMSVFFLPIQWKSVGSNFVLTPNIPETKEMHALVWKRKTLVFPFESKMHQSNYIIKGDPSPKNENCHLHVVPNQYDILSSVGTEIFWKFSFSRQSKSMVIKKGMDVHFIFLCFKPNNG